MEPIVTTGLAGPSLAAAHWDAHENERRKPTLRLPHAWTAPHAAGAASPRHRGLCTSCRISPRALLQPPAPPYKTSVGIATPLEEAA